MYVGCSLAYRQQQTVFHRVLVPTMYVGCSLTWNGVYLLSMRVLVPTMYVGCSSEICTKAVSLCSYFITMCCICQVLFPINFRFFILFSVLFVFLPIFWCESPFFIPQIDVKIGTFAELFLSIIS